MDTLFDILRVIGLIFLVLMVFNLMIVVHEWGHFLAARWRGLKIEKFYVWFGKALWKKTYNGVEYGLGSIPMGGFVALPQMAPMDAIEGKSDEAREVLPPISPLDKIIVAFAGPLFSFLLAVLFAFIVSSHWVGKPEFEIDTEKRIGYVGKDTPAERAGLKPGDEILSIDGKPVRGFRGLVDSVTWHIISSQNDNVDFLVKREGVPEPLHVPVKAEKPKENAQQKSWWRSLFARPAVRRAGIDPVETVKILKFMDESPNTPAEEGGLRKDDIIRTVDGQQVLNVNMLPDILEKRVGKATNFGIERDGKLMSLTITPRLPDQRPPDFTLEDQGALATLGVLEWNIAGRRVPTYPDPISQLRDAARTISETLRAITSPKSDVGAGHLSGFIGIANVYYNLLQDPEGWKRVMWFSVVLNVNLALLNLLPFPVLDGGHIVMAILEWIRRKPLNIRILEVMQTACVLLLLGFMVFVSFKDTGDVFGIGRKSDAHPGEKVDTKFLAPDKRPATQ